MALMAVLQVPEAHGRYITSHASTTSTKTLSDILQKRFPQYKFPAGEDQPSKEVIDNSKVSIFWMSSECPGDVLEVP